MKDFYVLHGDILYADEERRIREERDSYLVVRDGKVEEITSRIPASTAVLDYDGCLIIPGLIDLHLHAPQYQFAGLFMDKELLEWLNSHTFPEEGKYADLSYARKAYSIFVSDLVQSETTRFSAFATIHEDASLLLSSIICILSSFISSIFCQLPGSILLR